MPITSRSTRRVILLGVVISLAFLGFSLPRPVSKAQEPAKATDKKALREQIVALHAEIDLMEVEYGVDRQALFEAIKSEREYLDQFEAYFGNGPRSLEQHLFEKLQSCGWELASWLRESDDEELRKNLSREVKPEEEKQFTDYVVDNFGKKFADDLDALVKIEKKEEFSEARRRLANRAIEQVRKKSTESVREKADPLKKEFARRSAELAGKRLDLATLERQYHEAR